VSSLHNICVNFTQGIKAEHPDYNSAEKEGLPRKAAEVITKSFQAKNFVIPFL
jgi:hypothetical protein